LVQALDFFFLAYILIYTVFLFVCVTVSASVIERRARQNFLHHYNMLHNDVNYLPVSVLVPAHNEEISIADTIRSLLRSDYPDFEIIVIDDGSTDRTRDVVVNTFHLQKVSRPVRRVLPTKEAIEIYESVDDGKPIMLVVKENGGKADSLNMGINASRYPFFLSIDADTMVQIDTISELVRPIMENSRVIACGGMVQVSNSVVSKDDGSMEYHFPTGYLARCQILEYHRTFLSSRVFLDAFNGNMIISGACGLFRKDIVVQVGGYDTGVIGEDMELVVKLHSFCRCHRYGYRIVYSPTAICWTQAPASVEDLKKQRMRWHVGLLQSLIRYKHVLLNPRFGMMGIVSMIYYLIFEALAPFIEFTGLLFTMIAALFGILHEISMISYFTLFLAFSALVTITSFFSQMYVLATRLSFRRTLTVVCYALLECFGYRQIITFFRIRATIQYPKYRNKWEHGVRFANPTEEPGLGNE